MRSSTFVLGLALPFLLAGAAERASALTIFSETFDGYTSFPDAVKKKTDVTIKDGVNPGVPLIKEGADEVWHAGQFGTPETPCASCGSGGKKGGGWQDGNSQGGDFGIRHGGKGSHNITLDCDLGVQRIGGGGDKTPVARMDDHAGLLFAVDTTGLSDVMLSFDWRTFDAPAGDQSVAAYFVGNDPFSKAPICTGRKCPKQPESFGWGWGGHGHKGKGGGGDSVDVDPAKFTELVRADVHDDFTHNVFTLPGNVGLVWVAFWHDGGESDFTKIDNVVVTANPVPEPPTLMLLLAGTVGLVAMGRKRRS